MYAHVNANISDGGFTYNNIIRYTFSFINWLFANSLFHVFVYSIVVGLIHVDRVKPCKCVLQMNTIFNGRSSTKPFADATQKARLCAIKSIPASSRVKPASYQCLNVCRSVRRA